MRDKNPFLSLNQTKHSSKLQNIACSNPLAFIAVEDLAVTSLSQEVTDYFVVGLATILRGAWFGQARTRVSSLEGRTLVLRLQPETISA